ncbi:MAG: molybdate ABC transporter substrate-binding protein [Actinobacteria bacterium]|nr:molybdate ABC transporter substrate-binding protein [Actinomycetota bacterium]
MLGFTLEKRLRDFTLDLSLEVGTETLALIGYSGCGKSTMLRLLAGLLNPDEGRIELDERVLLDTGAGKNVAPEKRNVGFLVQNYALFPHLSVTDNVAYGISRLSREEQTKRVQDALDLVGIQHLATARPGNLSGGEQQRVALARAMARRPAYLLLDEPLSALDVTTRTRVRSELRAILESLGIPSIVVTHDYEDARILGHNIAVMERGRILQFGTPEEISRYPANIFVAAFADTNLTPIGNGRSAQVAFDPWRVTVAHEPAGAEYEWQGYVRGIRSMGAFTPVFAHVSPDDVRPIQTPEPPVRTEVEGKSVREEDNSPPRTRKRSFLSKIFMSNIFSRACGLTLMALLLVLILGACGGGGASGSEGAGGTLTAFVAANFTDANDAIVEEFESQHEGAQVQSNYAGTQILFSQLQQGASADFFLSADLDYAKRAQDEGLIDSFSDVSQNEEVIVVPTGNPAGVESLEDLGTKPVDLVIGVDTVPIGKYTRQIFENANEGYGSGFSDNVTRNVVSEETNTREVAQKIALGEGGAAIIYRTDVTPSIADQVEIVEIPKEYNVKAFNYAGVVKNAPNPELAQEYLDFILTPEGQEILRGFGYEPIE